MARKSKASDRRKYEVGSWDQASDYVRKLPRLRALVGRELLTRVATTTAITVKEKLKDQAYPHSPLTDAYLEHKRKSDLDLRILIATQYYLLRIGVYEDGDTIFAGVPDETHVYSNVNLRDLSNWLEFGTERMPPRPHLTVEYSNLKVVFAKEMVRSGLSYLGIIRSKPDDNSV